MHTWKSKMCRYMNAYIEGKQMEKTPEVDKAQELVWVLSHVGLTLTLKLKMKTLNCFSKQLFEAFS